MPSAGDDIRDRMRADWDARATENAFHYIASGRETWTLEEFLESGRRSVQGVVLEDLSRICGDRNPKDLRMLEIGCGAGRMTAALAEAFGEVHAVDVSPVMLAHAERALAGHPNVKLHLCDGASLSPLGDLAFDFILSYIVFQHIPDKAIVETYIRDAAHRLRPGGVFKFQVEGTDTSDILDTWRGAYFGPDDAVRTAAQCGCKIIAFDGLGQQYFWIWLQKPGLSEPPDCSSDLLIAEVARQRANLQSLDAELRTRTKWAQSLNERIEQLERTIRELQHQLNTSNSWAQGLEVENRELRGVVDERTAWAQERDDHSRTVVAELERLRNEFDDRTQWSLALERELDERTHWARRLEAELELHGQWLASIEKSFVYRIAARLRMIPRRRLASSEAKLR